MKAKEYFEKLNLADNKDQELVNISRLFINELIDLKKKRNIKYDHALIPILNELDNKWRKFAFMYNEKNTNSDFSVKYSGFKSIINLYFSKVYDYWTTGLIRQNT